MRETRHSASRARIKGHRGKAATGTRPGSASFMAQHDPETLAEEQGVSPVTDFDELLGDFWPEDENADDFVAAMREWRRTFRGS